MRKRTDLTNTNKQDRRFSLSNRIDFTMDLPFLLPAIKQSEAVSRATHHNRARGECHLFRASEEEGSVALSPGV
jgi:hypothetical protein